MPTYTFKDKNTGEVHDRVMKIAELDQFRLDNPHLETVIGAPALGDSVRLGVRKHDSGFKEVLQRIHEKTPGSTLNKVADV